MCSRSPWKYGQECQVTKAIQKKTVGGTITYPIEKDRKKGQNSHGYEAGRDLANHSILWA